MMPNADVNMPVTLPWTVVCRLACQALIEQCSFNDVVVQAIAENVTK